MFWLEYFVKRQSILFLLNVWNIIFSCSEDQHVSFSVTEVSLSDISTHPNVCVFCPPSSTPALEGTNTQTFGWVEMSESEIFVTLNDTYWSSEREKIKFQTFKRNKILWRFTRYSSQNMLVLEHIHNAGGQWKVKGYPLWYLNGLFITHFFISRFPYLLVITERKSSTASIISQHLC